MKRQIHLICNAHLDPVWLWEWQEGAAEAISTFRVAAELCEKDEGFIFNHNEAILYQWVREYDPDLFRRIQTLVTAGKWHIMGGWYLQPDCNMPSGESFVRQILAGRQFFKKHFNSCPTTAINFDPFGHSRGLVQILAKSGFTAYLFGRPRDDFMEMDDTPFVWEGFDGSEVIGRRFIGWYNTALGKSREQIEERICQSSNDVEAILWGVGNHGGGPSRKDLADVNALIRQRRDVEILHSTPDAYFDEVVKTAGSLPRRADDLNPWAIGCYTSMIRVKQKHRQLENELYMTEKMAACAAANKLIGYPKEDFDAAGRDLMFAQFHDILPGSCIQPAEEAALRLMDHGLEILSRVKARAFFALAAGQKKSKAGQIPILVYNPHPYPVEQDVECEFNLPDILHDGSFTNVRVVRNNQPVPAQVEQELSNIPADWRKRVVFRAMLKPGQMNRFDCTLHRLRDKPPVRLSSRNAMFAFKSDCLSIQINTRTGLVDRYRVHGVDYVSKGAFRPVVLEDNEDPWEVRKTQFGKTIGQFSLLSRSMAAKFSGVERSTLNSVRVIEDGPVRTVVEALFGFEESFICQRYLLPRRGSEIKVDTRVFWNQKNRMLKLLVPLSYAGSRYLGQTAFGVQELPTNGNEAVAQRWICAVDDSGDRSFSCINDGVYGSDLSGRKLRLSLLRSPAYSGHPIDENAIVPPDRFTPRIDQGERTFSFWFNAGSVATRLKAVSIEAQAKNEKPYAMSFFPKGDGQKPAPMALLSNTAIEAASVKKAESNTDWIVRLFNASDEKQTAQLRMPVLSVCTKLTFGPYEIKTLRINGRGTTQPVSLMEEKTKLNR